MRTLFVSEIDQVSGGFVFDKNPEKPSPKPGPGPEREPGPFEEIGEMLDSPFETLGRFIDAMGAPVDDDERTDHHHPDQRALRSA